jgi:two-component system response regulator
MHGKTVLIVEDDSDELDVAVRALRRAGMNLEVEIARDGQQALECLGIEASSDGAAAVRPSVIFLDLKMPRVDGCQVLSKIREHEATADLPVVVLSSSNRSADIQRSYQLGANSFLVKHNDRRSPGAYIAEAAHYWIELNVPPPRRQPE